MNSAESTNEDDHYCKECDDEVPATWNGGALICDVCEWVIYK